MKERVTAIAQAEGRKNNVIMEESQIDAVLKVSGGDMRRAVTSLQSVQALLAGNQLGNKNNVVVDETVINELAGLPPDQVIDSLYQSMMANSFDTMRSAVENVIADGYSVQTLLQKLLDKFIECDDLNELADTGTGSRDPASRGRGWRRKPLAEYIAECPVDKATRKRMRRAHARVS